MSIKDNHDIDTPASPFVDAVFIINRVAVAIVLCCLMLLLIKLL
jgi:hypothetical protein